VSSGNHAGKVGFNLSGKPAGIPVCATAADEPRDPGGFWAGLCGTCGRATTRRDADGYPRHAHVVTRSTARCEGTAGGEAR
jgi:hypothetical protein